MLNNKKKLTRTHFTVIYKQGVVRVMPRRYSIHLSYLDSNGFPVIFEKGGFVSKVKAQEELEKKKKELDTFIIKRKK